MHTKSFLSLFTLSLLICSCKKELEPQESSVPLTPPVAQAQPNNPNAPAQPGQPGQPVAVTPQNAPQMQMAPAQPAQVAAGMNPPHGQPNHRCDIAVGAPLNSPTGKTTTPAKPTMTIDPSTMTTNPSNGATPALLNQAQAAAPVATAPGMNPPHGQPGHRCDIAVGAPLASAGNSAAGGTGNAATPKMDITVSDPVKTEGKKTE